MRLRPYQVEAENAIFSMLHLHHSTLVEMATGTGKTVLFAQVAHRWSGRVLVIAHRDELIRQAAEKIQAVTGDQVAIEMGVERAEDTLYGSKVTVGSIQTLARSRRRSRFHPSHFSLIIVDEAHHAAAATYREVLDYFDTAKRLFVTATPKRGDGIALGTVCDSVAFQYGIEPAIDDGWLVPVRQTVVKVENLDFSKARTVAADFNAGDLERILTEEEPLHAMVASANELIGNQQALWFCVSVAHAKACAGVLARYVDSSRVAFLSGDTRTEDRRSVVDAYKAGKVQHLLNCALFLEGFDAPNTSAIVMGRPTKSLALYMQVLGRGTRPLPGIVDGIEGADARRQAIAMSDKPHMTVIDFAGNAGKHKIVQAADILGGKHELPTRDYAKKTMEEEGKPVDIEEALERAKQELELLAEEDTRRKAITAKVQYSAYNVSPFTKEYTGSYDAAKTVKPNAPKPDACSDKTAWYLHFLSKKQWSFEKAKQLSQKQAGAVIRKLQGGQ